MLASKSPNAKTQAKDGKGKENEKAAKTRDGSSSTRKKDSSSAPSQDSSSKAVDSLSRGLASLTLSLPPPLSQSGESSTGPRATKVIEDYNSPIQLITRGPDWKKLAPQAKHGMLGIGNMPLNFTNVVSNDWNGRKTEVSEELRREAKAMSVRSAVPAAVSDRNVDQLVVMTPAELAAEVDGEAESSDQGVKQSGIDDRFIARRDEAPRGHAFNATAEDSSSPGHTARVKDALGLQPTNKRILNFHNAAPTPSADPALALQRQLATPLYARPGTLASSVGVYTNKSRHIATVPERILDAPGMIDDYYLNLISWSCENVLGVALAASTYTWNAETGSVDHLGTCADGTYVASLDFSNDGTYLGVGVGTGDVEVWDIETGTKLRSMTGHQAQVSVLSWNQHILSSGCVDGSIWHHDVRIARHKVMEMNGHTGEVCGLKWRQDGELIASGGNDNLVNCWEPRLGDVVEGARGQPKWQKTNHTAAVKAIAWAPWNPNIVASGGGTGDCTVHFWSAQTGARLHSLLTPSQVTSIQFSPHTKEVFTTHGFPTNSIMLHAYPSLEKVAEIRDAHDSRVLNSAVGPGGDVVVTSAADENIKFWRLWEVPKKSKKAATSQVVEKGLRSIR